MLDAGAELGEHVVGNVFRRLRDEKDSDAFGADEPDRLNDLVEKLLACVGKEEVRLVEEEDELGLVGVAHLGQVLEEGGEKPHDEGGKQRRL